MRNGARTNREGSNRAGSNRAGSTRGSASALAAPPETARGLAIDALVRIEGGAYSNVLVPELLRGSKLSVRDRAFATDLVYGTLRRQRSLDWLLARSLRRPLLGLDAVTRAALRIGAYQLLNGVAVHAAVSETVDAVGARQDRSRALVNAVLRSTSRLGPDWPWPGGDASERSVDAIGVRTSHPDWIVELLADAFGWSDALATLEAANVAGALTLRVEMDRASPDQVRAELEEIGATVEAGSFVRNALVVGGAGDTGRLGAVAEGRATPQDQTSQAVVELLEVQPGNRVLEVGAAPGGKATGIAARVAPSGVVVALDVHPMRARRITTAARRLQRTNLDVMVADGRALPFSPAARFDRILIDAPCSGLGVLRRRAEARWRITPRDVTDLAALQRELLAAAAPLLASGGRLLYSVCTLTIPETREVDEWAADALPHLVACPPPGGPWRNWGRGAILLPGDAGTDGMYVLILGTGAATEGVHAVAG